MKITIEVQPAFDHPLSFAKACKTVARMLTQLAEQAEDTYPEKLQGTRHPVYEYYDERYEQRRQEIGAIVISDIEHAGQP